jgi:hypothetical protein
MQRAAEWSCTGETAEQIAVATASASKEPAGTSGPRHAAAATQAASTADGLASRQDTLNSPSRSARLAATAISAGVRISWAGTTDASRKAVEKSA